MLPISNMQATQLVTVNSNSLYTTVKILTGNGNSINSNNINNSNDNTKLVTVTVNSLSC